MADATHFVEAPTRSPRRGGIRSVAEFRTQERLGLGGVLEYTSTGCGIAVGAVELCYPSPADPQAEKVRDDVSTLTGGSVFGLYFGVECFIDGDDYLAESRAGLERGEDRGIEAALAAWVAATAVQGVGTDLTDLIAKADAFADGQYAGRPVITMNRGDAVQAYADGALDADKEGNIWTPNGSPVLASALFPVGEVDAIGAVTVYTGGDPVANITRDVVTNREFAIAENVYALVVDCNVRYRFIIDTP